MNHHIVERPVAEGFLVLDYGSQYTLLIARRLREIGVYAEVIDGEAAKPPSSFEFHGIILSGGPDSVTEEGARRLPQWVMESGKPLLGICYGMQLLVETIGGKVTEGIHREYGRATLTLEEGALQASQGFLAGIPKDQTVWMSHGDTVSGIESTFVALGRTDSGVLAAISHKTKPYFGLQFHPEVQHSTHGGDLLRNFVTGICKAPLNWRDDDRLSAITASIRKTVGDGHVLMAVSGGVDSTVAVALLTRALSTEKVQAVFVDNGLLRKDEVLEVEGMFRELGLTNLTTLDRSKVFLDKLAGVSDPEEKRKIIGRTFIEEFEAFAKSSEKNFTHLGQGTLYPDVIESAGHGSGAKVIKSHHNVGGLPERLAMELVEPFRYLFKDEVRDIGASIEIPRRLVDRHPFPGPGLAVRQLGAIEEEKLDILREADAIFIRKLHEEGYYKRVWQAFAVLLPVKTVGVMGDNRTYQWTCALRAVTATDGMTAGVGDLPISFLVSVSDEIVRKVDGINRVVYDITSKPPSTIEWE